MAVKCWSWSCELARWGSLPAFGMVGHGHVWSHGSQRAPIWTLNLSEPQEFAFEMVVSQRDAGNIMVVSWEKTCKRVVLIT